MPHCVYGLAHAKRAALQRSCFISTAQRRIFGLLESLTTVSVIFRDSAGEKFLKNR